MLTSLSALTIVENIVRSIFGGSKMALYMDHTLNIGITLAILRLSTGNIPVVMVGLLKGCLVLLVRFYYVLAL